MKRILLLAQHFPPTAGVGVQRPSSFAQYLPEFGWEPVVITGPILSDMPTDEERLRRLGPVEIHRTDLSKLFGVHNRGLRWVLPAYQAAVRLITAKPVDVVLCTGGPFIPFVVPWLLWRRFHIPYVLDYRDPWGLSPYMGRRGWKIQLMSAAERWLEQRVVNSASLVLGVSGLMVSEMQQSFFNQPADKFAALHNGFDEAGFANLEPMPLGAHTFNIVYVGTVGDPHYPFARLFHALSQVLQKSPTLGTRLRLHLVGRVSAQYSALIRELQLEPIVVEHGFKPHREALRFMLGADLLYLLIDNSLGQGDLRYDVSGKLFEYLRANKPVLADVPNDGEAYRLLQAAGVLIWAGRSTEKTAALIASMLQARPDFHAIRAYVDQFDRRRQAEQLAGYLQDVVGARGR